MLSSHEPTMLPDYISKAIPRPKSARAAWYTNTAPTYAGVFLWIGFYESIASGTLNRAGLAVSFLALVASALLCVALYYYAPAMLGMKTGLPLYVIGSSTFGARGGYLIPGLLMGALQVGWYGVSTDLATRFLLKSVGEPAQYGTVPYVITAIVWGYTIAWVAAMGIRYVSRVAILANLIPFFMILIVCFKTSRWISRLPADRTKFACRFRVAHSNCHRLFCHCGRGWGGFRNGESKYARCAARRSHRHRLGHCLHWRPDAACNGRCPRAPSRARLLRLRFSDRTGRRSAC